MAHRASNKCRIFTVSGVVVSTVEHSGGLVILGREAPEKSDETGLVIDLCQSKLGIKWALRTQGRIL